MTTDATSARPPLSERALSQRVRAVPPSGIRRFFDIIATMDDVISLGVGEPDFDTPREIVEAGVESLREGRTHYTSNFGTIELRRALSEHLRAPLRRPLRPGDRDPDHRRRVGGRGPGPAGDLRPGRRGHPPRAVVRGLRAGDRVRRRHGRPVATRFEDDFALDPAAVEAAITPRTKALFLGYPANPTGAVLDDDVQDELARIARDHDLLVYSDEIYDRLAYGTYRHRAFSSLPGMRERTILMGGFSKAYAMTGWRVGWLCAPAPILEGIVKVHQYGIMSAPTVAQDAALVALRDGEPAVEAMVAEYDRRRRLLVDGLNRIGLPTFEPRGAFYAFPDITSTGLTSDEFTERLLREEQVAVRARERVRAVRRGPRAHVLRHLVREDRGGARAHRAVRGASPATSRGRPPAGTTAASGPERDLRPFPGGSCARNVRCRRVRVRRIGPSPASMEVRHDQSARRPPRHRPGRPGGRVAPPVRLPAWSSAAVPRRTRARSSTAAPAQLADDSDVLVYDAWASGDIDGSDGPDRGPPPSPSARADRAHLPRGRSDGLRRRARPTAWCRCYGQPTGARLHEAIQQAIGTASGVGGPPPG